MDGNVLATFISILPPAQAAAAAAAAAAAVHSPARVEEAEEGIAARG